MELVIPSLKQVLTLFVVHVPYVTISQWPLLFFIIIPLIMLILVGDGVGAKVGAVGADDTEGANERVGASDGTEESEGAAEQK